MVILPNPFVQESEVFVLDVDRFMEDIEAPPICFSSPSPAYMEAVDFRRLAEVLTKY